MGLPRSTRLRLDINCLLRDPLLAAAKLENSQLGNGSLGILLHGLLYSTWGLLSLSLTLILLLANFREHNSSQNACREGALRDWASFLDCASPLVGSARPLERDQFYVCYDEVHLDFCWQFCFCDLE